MLNFKNNKMRIEIDKDTRQMAMLCHLTAFATFVIPGVGSIVGPLIVWLLKKDRSEFIDFHGKEALNFQITILILAAIAGVLCFFLIGIPLLFAVGVYWFVFTIIASIKANEGAYYKYPFVIRILT